MVDIDDFRPINDTHGHQQGDVVLTHVARVLQDSSRDADTPARYGGEEMALILPPAELEGVVASSDEHKHALIAAADTALSVAKRRGKNQTVRAKVQTANVVTAE